MDGVTLFSSMLDDPLPWVIAGLTMVAPAIFFLFLLWSLRVTRLLFLKSIDCPETGRGATVGLIAHVGELGSYRDVRACSLPPNEREITCRKACLTTATVREAPYIIVRRA